MDIVKYYTTTLLTAFGKLGPLVLFVIVVYVFVIKLPFYFAVKVQKANKKSEAPAAEVPKIEVQKPRLEARAERKEEKKEEKKEKKPEPPKAKRPRLSLAEELFDLDPERTYTQAELKKKYYELLKKNHPDKVDALGEDFKKLAEKKTKAINEAYQKLRSKAS